MFLECCYDFGSKVCGTVYKKGNYQQYLTIWGSRKGSCFVDRVVGIGQKEPYAFENYLFCCQVSCNINLNSWENALSASST